MALEVVEKLRRQVGHRYDSEDLPTNLLIMTFTITRITRGEALHLACSRVQILELVLISLVVTIYLLSEAVKETKLSAGLRESSNVYNVDSIYEK